MADLEPGAEDSRVGPSSLWGFVVDNQDLAILQLQMLGTALAIIYAGAHGSLRRPPSAAPRQPKEAKDGGKDGKKNKKKKKKEEGFAEGLEASDAILFPILAGTVLIGLYYLIQWLNDPQLLNRILKYYLSAASLVSLGKFLGDFLHLLTAVALPNVWSDLSGRQLFRVDAANRRVLRRVATRGAGGSLDDKDRDAEDVWEADESHPLPIPIGSPIWRAIGLDRYKQKIWDLRHLLKEHWSVELGLHGLGAEEFSVTLNGLFGVLAAGVIAFAYNATDSPALSNLMGMGMSYGAFMLMSPTSFGIGSMVLAGLFIYDIVMVFYTPYMITVATKIDAPIKLVFDNKAKSSLLGLGDIIIPGIFICLSLRFDLWLFYKKQIKRVPTDLTTTELRNNIESGVSVDSNSTSTTVTKRVETKEVEVKTEFINPQGRWGDWLWTMTLNRYTPGVRASTFPKPYFVASMIGYAVGMFLTVTMLFVFQHGQPALLYLVPSVLGAAWLTGAVRGELGDMWKYTEDGSLDTKDAVVEVDAEGNVIKGDDGDKDGKSKNKGEVASEKDKARQQGYDVFRLVVAAPGIDDLDDDDEY